MTDPYDIVVAIPARDEAARIEKCLTSVIASVDHALAAGSVGRVTIAIAADRCLDDTADLARGLFARAPAYSTLVWETDEILPVGAVRSGLIRRAIACDSHNAARTWIFSTDADSVVPMDWLTTGLRLVAEANAAMIVGLVDLDPLEAHPRIRLAHDQLVRAGLHVDGSHDHVYAANLAIRADAYAALGGFPAVIKGEEQALLHAARVAGHVVLTTSRWRVQTSARLRARARGGLGDLLRWMSESEERAG